SAATTTEGFALEDHIVHAVDDGTLGFIRVHSGNVYVTPDRHVGPRTAHIQRAVAAADSGDTIYIKAGSYTGDINAASVLDIDGLTVSKDLTLKPSSATPPGYGPGQ